MLAVSTMLSPVGLLVSPLRTPVAPRLAPLRAPVLRMDKSEGIEYFKTPALNGDAADAASPLDTTAKFEEIACAAAVADSAAEAEGFEPGTCDPYDPKSAEFCSPEPESTSFLSARTLKLTVLFFLWYALNTAYNIGNKLVLTALPIPWTSATIELFFGLPYVGMLWLTGLRKKPKLSLDNIKTLAPSAFFLSATHVGGVISFGAGAISFTHVLKVCDCVPHCASNTEHTRLKLFTPLWLLSLTRLLHRSPAALLRRRSRFGPSCFPRSSSASSSPGRFTLRSSRSSAALASLR